MAPRSKEIIKQAQWVASKSLLFSDDRSPFRATVVSGDPRLLLLVGENASGKSLFFRVLMSRFQIADTSPITISIRERCGSGYHEMAGMRRVMMFGDEHEQSTGATSVNVINSGFKNLDSREKSVLGLDEPELGLSDGYAGALGEFIGDKAMEIPTTCRGVVVVTHSRTMVHGLLRNFMPTPTFVRTGEGPATLDEWLETPETHSVDELLTLQEVALDRWRTTSKLLDDRKPKGR